MNFAHTGRAAILLAALILAACGGGASTEPTPDPQANASCDPANDATHDECGTVFIGLTDADGDFLSYTVDVLSLELERADGSVINVLPNSTRIDFAQYVDLTEFISVATVPLESRETAMLPDVAQRVAADNVDR